MNYYIILRDERSEENKKGIMEDMFRTEVYFNWNKISNEIKKSTIVTEQKCDFYTGNMCVAWTNLREGKRLDVIQFVTIGANSKATAI
jgi:hypothetical protein